MTRSAMAIFEYDRGRNQDKLGEVCFPIGRVGKGN